MKIEIQGRPEFRFEINKPAIDLLVKLSSTHYDGHCRSISQMGGFLRGWENHYLWGLQEPESVIKVSATFRDLDTLLKVMEMPHNLSKEELHLRGALALSFGNALAMSNEVCPKWSHVLQTNWELAPPIK